MHFPVKVVGVLELKMLSKSAEKSPEVLVLNVDD